MTDNAATRAIQAAFDRWVERMNADVDEMLRAFDDDPYALARSLEGADWEGDIARPFLDELEEQVIRVHTKEMSRETTRLAIEGFFDNGGSPWARAFASTHGAELVRHVSTNTKAGIRTIVDDGLRAGLNPRVVARDVRRIVGLHPQWSRAVANMDARLLAQGVAEGRRLRLVDRYAKRLLRVRAENIARSEMITAYNQGHLDAWDVGIDQGALPGNAKKQWIAGMNERTCPICMDLNGQVVGIKDMFYSGVLGTRLLRPTAHPSCRCTMVLKL